MKILITNAQFEKYHGTEVVIRDLALELKRQGHEPEVYSPRLGPPADEIRKAGIPVTDRLSAIQSVPDVIHGHHQQTLEALLYFPLVPAIFVCHGAKHYAETPFYFPRILRYVAVDELCRQRIASISDIPSDRIEVIWNAANLARFQPRGPLPYRPKRALVFSHGAGPSTHLNAIRKACRRMGLQVDVAGVFSGNYVPNPENLLPRYDIVFAKARCALEAIAVGNAVVLCDVKGLGPMVSTENFDTLRPLNFGSGVLVKPHQPELISREVERYDPEDAAAVSQRVREEAGLVESTRRWVQLYADVIEEFSHSQRSPNEEFRASADYLAKWSYAKRVDWELDQVRKMRSMPIVGRPLMYFARIFRRWFGLSSEIS